MENDPIENVSTEQTNEPVYKTLNRLDDRLFVHGSTDFEVFRGASNIGYTVETAQSDSTSSTSFNITLPSMNNIMDRVVFLEQTKTITIKGTSNAADTYAYQWGRNTAFAPLPLHADMSTFNVQTNGISTSYDVRPIYPYLVRLLDRHTMEEYANICPMEPDYYRDYASTFNANDVVGGDALVNNNVLGDYKWILKKFVPRGAYNISLATPNAAVAETGAINVNITYTMREPLLLPPFIPSHNGKGDCEGMFGLQNVKLTINYNSSAPRSIRTALKAGAGANTSNITGLSYALTTVEQSRLYCVFLTPPPEMVLPRRCVTPIYDFVHYSKNLTAANPNVISDNVQLNCIPDYVLISVRKQSTALNSQDADFCYPIKNVVVNFNNGVYCSNMSQYNLWLATKENGCNASWPEFFGQVLSSAAGNPTALATSGSPIMLGFGKEIDINQSFNAPGSIGNFSFSCSVTLAPEAGVIPAGCELSLLFLSAGMLVHASGSSTKMVGGLLGMKDVLDASQKEPINRDSSLRLVGGGMWGSLKSALKKGWKPIIKPLAKQALNLAPVSDNVKAVGNAVLGNGRFSGGKLKNRVF